MKDGAVTQSGKFKGGIDVRRKDVDSLLITGDLVAMAYSGGNAPQAAGTAERQSGEMQGSLSSASPLNPPSPANELPRCLCTWKPGRAAFLKHLHCVRNTASYPLFTTHLKVL